jgi:hypothetical protein
VSTDTPAPRSRGRIGQILDTYKLTRRADPAIGWILLGLFVAVMAVFVALGFFFGPWWFWILLGIPSALLVVTIVFGRRAEKAAYAQVEGQPGAVAAVLTTLRSGWYVTPAVAVTKNQDMVHRVVGRPGVILVSEAPASRASNLLANERKRTARFLPETPIIELECGDDEGQIPLRKINSRIMRQPRNLKPAQVTAIRRRLDAVSQNPVPLPKGPLPKNARIPRG